MVEVLGGMNNENRVYMAAMLAQRKVLRNKGKKFGLPSYEILPGASTGSAVGLTAAPPAAGLTAAPPEAAPCQRKLLGVAAPAGLLAKSSRLLFFLCRAWSFSGT